MKCGLKGCLDERFGTVTKLLQLETKHEKSTSPIEEHVKMVPNSVFFFVKILWEELEKTKEKKEKKGTAHITKINLDKKQPHVDFIIGCRDKGPNSLCTRKVESMKELPSFFL